MIDWPCIMKLEGDDELLYFSAENELVSECQSLIWSDSDYIIDSSGYSYLLHESDSKSFDYVMRTQRFSTEDLSALIRAHEFSKAEVCLTKIHFTSVAEAINALSMSK